MFRTNIPEMSELNYFVIQLDMQQIRMQKSYLSCKFQKQYNFMWTEKTFCRQKVSRVSANADEVG